MDEGFAFSKVGLGWVDLLTMRSRPLAGPSVRHTCG